mgnify:CR=1 FL=1
MKIKNLLFTIALLFIGNFVFAQFARVKGIILDVRSNPGGLLDQAVAVCEYFLDHGVIVSTKGNQDKENVVISAGRFVEKAPAVPMVVLINSGSASASEIVAGALQDHRRAVLMGTRSFGKGSVQTVIPVSGDGALRLTTARYFTPSGRSIQGKGIDPDIVVDQAKIEKLEEMGIHEEDLKGALSNPTNQPSKSGDAANDNKKPEEKESDKDYQLARALDLLQGLSLMRENSK